MNLQAPNTKLQGNTKLQTSTAAWKYYGIGPACCRPNAARLELGTWSFPGAWCLELGGCFDVRSRLRSACMRLLDRYLLRELLAPLGYCLSGFLIVWVAFELFSDMGELQDHKLR